MVQFGWIFKTGLKETDRQKKVEGKRNEKTEQQE